MATAYTESIANDISFEQFALQCASAFGACMSMHEELMNTDIPKLVPSEERYSNQLSSANKRFAELSAMNIAEAEIESRKVFLDAYDRWQARCCEQAALNAKYEAMLAQVEAWTPPSPDHEGLKKFMVQQITSSMSTYEAPPPVPLSALDWLVAELDTAWKNVKYYTNKHVTEFKWVANRNEWMRALRESLHSTESET